MNQILVTKKLYITPELKRKKKLYKFYFFLSVFLVFSLISFYIYAEVDRSKSEETSQAILDDFNKEIDTTTADSDVLIAVLNDNSSDNNSSSLPASQNQPQRTVNTSKQQTTSSGYNYSTVAIINIPKIDVNESEELLSKMNNIKKTIEISDVRNSFFYKEFNLEKEEVDAIESMWVAPKYKCKVGEYYGI